MQSDDPAPDAPLPTTVTPSGRVVFDPTRVPKPAAEPEAAAKLRRAVDELRAREAADARDAPPAPVEIAPGEDGALITGAAQDAARAHVEAAVPESARPARIDSAPVKILDPRRVPTTRVEKRSPWVAEAAARREAAGGEHDRSPMPSSIATESSRGEEGRGEGTSLAPGSGGERRRWAVRAAIVVPIAIAATLLVLRLWRVEPSPVAPRPSETSPPSGSTQPAARPPSSGEVPTASGPASFPVPSAPTASVAASAWVPAATVRPPARVTADPYADAGPPQAGTAGTAVPSASSSAPGAMATPSVAPAPASAAPSTTSTARPFAPFDPEKD